MVTRKPGKNQRGAASG